jgi:hypothetical protein
MIPLDVVRTIVTDAPVPEEAREVVNNLNIELLTAESPVEK